MSEYQCKCIHAWIPMHEIPSMDMHGYPCMAILAWISMHGYLTSNPAGRPAGYLAGQPASLAWWTHRSLRGLGLREGLQKPSLTTHTTAPHLRRAEHHNLVSLWRNGVEQKRKTRFSTKLPVTGNVTEALLNIKSLYTMVHTLYV